MHFEILVEGKIELTALSILMPQIVGEYKKPHTWRIHPHRGIGKLPENPKDQPLNNDHTLLHNLPSKLRAYGNSKVADTVIVVLVDLDIREDCVAFKSELKGLLEYCAKKPTVVFRIAIEELEAWLLSDREAVLKAYPNADKSILESYVPDSQLGTWEILADVVYEGGYRKLEKKYGKRSRRILEEKRKWSRAICPHMKLAENKSPSFQVFCTGLQKYL